MDIKPHRDYTHMITSNSWPITHLITFTFNLELNPFKILSFNRILKTGREFAYKLYNSTKLESLNNSYCCIYELK